jgi:hypothetical protein
VSARHAAHGARAHTHHPLGDDDVDLVDGQLDLLDLAVEQRDHVREAVHAHDLLRLLDDGGAVDADHLGRAGLGGEETQNACASRRSAVDTREHTAQARGARTRAAAHVEHDLALKEVPVVRDGLHVRLGTHAVLEHLLVDACGAARRAQRRE